MNFWKDWNKFCGGNFRTTLNSTLNTLQNPSSPLSDDVTASSQSLLVSLYHQKYQMKQTIELPACTVCINPNLQQHRAVSVLQHGFLV